MRIAAACAVLVVHWILQFIFWSEAGRHVSMREAWNVLSFPMFQLASAFANEYFWTLSVINSAVWGVVCAYAIPRICRALG